jgi:hypothetical protein
MAFKNYEPPELEARREREHLLVRKRKADEERAGEEAFWVCGGWDKELKRMRWVNEMTGEAKLQVIGSKKEGSGGAGRAVVGWWWRVAHN